MTGNDSLSLTWILLYPEPRVSQVVNLILVCCLLNPDMNLWGGLTGYGMNESHLVEGRAGQEKWVVCFDWVVCSQLVSVCICVSPLYIYLFVR